MSKLIQHAMVSLLVLILVSCHRGPSVTTETGSSPPRFVFADDTVVDMLLVYHESADLVCKGRLLDQLLDDKTNMVWMIEGQLDSRAPITFGAVSRNN